MMAQEPTHHDIAADLLLVLIPSVVAAFAAIYSSLISHGNRKRIHSELDTGNEKKIGTYVHEISQMQEIQSAISHTNTKELLDVVEKLLQLDERLELHVTESSAVHSFLLERVGVTLDEVTKDAKDDTESG